MSPIDLANPGRTINAGVILMGGVTELLDVAPIELLAGLRANFLELMPIPDSLKAQALDVSIHWVNENGTDAKMSAGMDIKTTDSFASCPPLDIVLIGAHFPGYNPNEAELDFVRKQYDNCTSFMTVCGGIEVPLRAGLLKGKTVTGPAEFIPQFSQLSPDTTWVKKRYVNDGKLWTSGVLLNGMDLFRAWGTEIWGGKPGSLMDATLDLGSWPKRDVDFKDGP